MVYRSRVSAKLFLSTPSSQRATPYDEPEEPEAAISIHALFAEGDVDSLPAGLTSTISIHALFAEGDLLKLRTYNSDKISIHALFAEGDGRALFMCSVAI